MFLLKLVGDIRTSVKNLLNPLNLLWYNVSTFDSNRSKYTYAKLGHSLIHKQGAPMGDYTNVKLVENFLKSGGMEARFENVS